MAGLFSTNACNGEGEEGRQKKTRKQSEIKESLYKCAARKKKEEAQHKCTFPLAIVSLNKNMNTNIYYRTQHTKLYSMWFLP